MKKYRFGRILTIVLIISSLGFFLIYYFSPTHFSSNNLPLNNYIFSIIPYEKNIEIEIQAGLEWGDNGTPICTETNSQQYPKPCSDGMGGAIISWF
ncbi:MAG: hypothetical protein HWN67_01610, partial [Candidatus Helarchaeota archaeon]|nr:hypothetical protein [Candidatus Helarchaeota archaeon]